MIDQITYDVMRRIIQLNVTAPMYPSHTFSEKMLTADVAAIGLASLGRQVVVGPGTMNRMMSIMMTRLMPCRMASGMFGSMMSRVMDPTIL